MVPFWVRTLMGETLIRVIALFATLFSLGADATQFGWATDLNLAVFNDSGWTIEEVADQLSRAQETFGQCGIRIATASVHNVRASRGTTQLVKFNWNTEHSISQLAEEVRDLPRPLIMMVGKFDADNSLDYAFSRAAFVGTSYPSAILDTVWLPHSVASSSAPYSTLAHELTHLLTLDPEHNGDAVPNLMTVSSRRTNAVTRELCRGLRASRYVRVDGRPMVAELQAQ